MIAVLAILLLTAAGSEPASDAPSSREPAMIRRVERALESDEELLSLHRGYLSYLDKHPEMAALESAYLTLAQKPEFAAVVSAFDHTLVQHPEQEAAFNKYSTFLKSNGAARGLVGTISQTLAASGDAGDLGESLDFLRANPGNAIALLKNAEKEGGAPPALVPLLEQFKEHPEWREQLLHAFLGIESQPEARSKVYPWWRAAAETDQGLAGKNRALEHYLAQHPDESDLWQRRAAALASEDHARAWIRYWHDRIQGNAVLTQHYWEYLDALNGHPELERQAEDRWAKAHGSAASWPPEGPPPALQRTDTYTRNSPSRESKSKSASQRPERPGRPTAKRPSRPEPRQWVGANGATAERRRSN